MAAALFLPLLTAHCNDFLRPNFLLSEGIRHPHKSQIRVGSENHHAAAVRMLSGLTIARSATRCRHRASVAIYDIANWSGEKDSMDGGEDEGFQGEEGEAALKESVLPEEVDVVVIGAGLGGICCAALLAKYGLSVGVCESHTIPGGAAHSFVRRGFHFDSGPSFHAGLSLDKSLNPLKQRHRLREGSARR